MVYTTLLALACFIAGLAAGLGLYHWGQKILAKPSHIYLPPLSPPPVVVAPPPTSRPQLDPSSLDSTDRARMEARAAEWLHQELRRAGLAAKPADIQRSIEEMFADAGL